MLPRIPHDQETFSSRQAVESFAAMSKKYARSQYHWWQATLPGLRSGRCLDVGAGPGVLAAMIARNNPRLEVTAVDASPQMAEYARRYLKDQGLSDRVSYEVLDVNDAQARAGLGRFDVVYSLFSLHHWDDPVASLHGLWQCVSDDGGALYLLDLKRVWWLYCLPLRNGFVDSIRAAYLPTEITGMMKEAGIATCDLETQFPMAFIQSAVARKRSRPKSHPPHP